MKQEIKINHLKGWSQLTENILRSIADFNSSGNGWSDLDSAEKYVKWYNGIVPKGIFNYTTAKPDAHTLEIFADDELLLSITMCEVHELVNNENY